MKKSKFLKALTALAVGAVAATSALSLAACGGDDGHKHATTHDWEKDATGHWHVCDEDSERFDEGQHEYTLENGTNANAAQLSLLPAAMAEPQPK